MVEKSVRLHFFVSKELLNRPIKLSEFREAINFFKLEMMNDIHGETTDLFRNEMNRTKQMLDYYVVDGGNIDDIYRIKDDVVLLSRIIERYLLIKIKFLETEFDLETRTFKKSTALPKATKELLSKSIKKTGTTTSTKTKKSKKVQSEVAPVVEPDDFEAALEAVSGVDTSKDIETDEQKNPSTIEDDIDAMRAALIY